MVRECARRLRQLRWFARFPPKFGTKSLSCCGLSRPKTSIPWKNTFQSNIPMTNSLVFQPNTKYSTMDIPSPNTNRKQEDRFQHLFQNIQTDIHNLAPATTMCPVLPFTFQTIECANWCSNRVHQLHLHVSLNEPLCSCSNHKLHTSVRIIDLNYANYSQSRPQTQQFAIPAPLLLYNLRVSLVQLLYSWSNHKYCNHTVFCPPPHFKTPLSDNWCSDQVHQPHSCTHGLFMDYLKTSTYDDTGLQCPGHLCVVKLVAFFATQLQVSQHCCFTLLTVPKHMLPPMCL